MMMMTHAGPLPELDPIDQPPQRVEWSIPRWVSIAWAISPAAILLIFIMAFGKRWEYLSYVGFLGGVMNMLVFSAAHLHARGDREWLLRAVPLALLMVAINAGLMLLGSALLEAADLIPPDAPPVTTPQPQSPRQ